MLWGGVANGGALELRRDEKGGVRLAGRFPYGVETTLAPGRAERIEARAFGRRIAEGGEIHLLAQHDYDKPLASRSAGNLTVTDTDEALVIDAQIDGGTSWAADFLAAHRAGLIRGLSPGFRVYPGGDRIERRGNGVVRSVVEAELFEISAVTVPAYPTAQVEARCWKPGHDAPDAGVMRQLQRWRL